MNRMVTKIGEIQYEKQEVIHFPEGLFGFEHLKDFLIVKNEDAIFDYLQSVEERDITFVIGDPKALVKDYTLKIHEADYTHLEIENPEDLMDFVIITIPKDIENISANLLGPVIVNEKSRQGRQVISQNSNYTTKYRILDDIRKLAS